MRIGVHTSIAKGLVRALDNAGSMGANCIQIFSSSPRSFNTPQVSDTICAEFKKEALQKNIGPNFIHATYLVNLASSNPILLEKSIESLTADLVFASKTGIKGVVVHTGSHKGDGFASIVPTVTKSIKAILAAIPSDVYLYMEVASGGKGKIGSSFNELQTLLESVNHAQLGVFLDTAHLFVGGRSFETKEKIDALAKEIETTVGWSKVGGIHTNDSKGAFNSYLDRHENIGKGFIGLEPFRLLVNHSEFKKLPFVLEVPGFDDKGPDKKNVEIVKSLVV